MAFKISLMAVKLRDEPRDDSPNSAGIVLGSDRLHKIGDAAIPEWWKVRVVTPGAAPREGFVRAEFLVEVEADTPDPEIDKESLYQQLTFAARSHSSNRDYLYAIAFLESGVKNIKSKSSAAFGPFQFMPSTWNDMVVRHGAKTGISEADIVLPGSQAIFAAIYSNDAQESLTKALNKVPTAAELYLAHLLGPAGAGAVLAAGNDKPVDVPLRVFYKGTTLGAGHVDKILSANSDLLMTGGQVCTTEEVLDKVVTKLEKGLAEAAALAKKLGPPVSETPGNQGDPPWLAVALKQLDEKIKEDKAPNKSNPKIERYFTATSLGSATDDVPWCAAFVSWCMAESGNEVIVARNRRSAWAPDWLSWGFAVGRPARGAVALTGPLEDGTPGHMGFVVGEEGPNILLLAGNQSDAVTVAKVAKTSVVNYRWLDWK